MQMLKLKDQTQICQLAWPVFACKQLSKQLAVPKKEINTLGWLQLGDLARWLADLKWSLSTPGPGQD